MFPEGDNQRTELTSVGAEHIEWRFFTAPLGAELQQLTVSQLFADIEPRLVGYAFACHGPAPHQLAIIGDSIAFDLHCDLARL